MRRPDHHIIPHMRPFILFLAVVAFSTYALAAGVYQNPDELRLVQTMSVRVIDQVKNGCLQNPKELKAEAERILQQSGINISSEPSEQDHRILIAAAGGEVKLPNSQVEFCMTTVDVNVARFIRAPEGHLVAVWAYKLGALVGGASKPKSQENLRAAVSQIVGDLANEIQKARGN
jgi:hypothetical protein